MGVVILTGDQYKADGLYQWDQNQVLEISGLSLPQKPEIHFANINMDRSIVRQSNMDSSGVITVEVPNSLLQSIYPIKVYVCGYEGTTFKTYYDFDIHIIPRPKPADYRVVTRDQEVYSFTKLENRINNFNEDMLKTIKSWIVNDLLTTTADKILDARQGKVLKDLINTKANEVGDIKALTTENKTSVVEGVNSLVKSVSGRFGDLKTLSTKVKDSVVNAINELKTNIDSKGTDTTSADITAKIGDLLTLATTAKDSLVNAINEIHTALGLKQDKLTNPLTATDIVDNLTTRDSSKVLSASQGYSLGFDLDLISKRFECVSGRPNLSTAFRFDSTFSGFISVDTDGDPNGGGLFYVYAYGTGVDLSVQTIYKGSFVNAIVSPDRNALVITNSTGKRYYVSIFTLFNRKPKLI